MGVSDHYDAARATAARCPTVALRLWHARLMRSAGRRRMTRPEAARLLAVRSVLHERLSTTVETAAAEATAAVNRDLAPMRSPA